MGKAIYTFDKEVRQFKILREPPPSAPDEYFDPDREAPSSISSARPVPPEHIICEVNINKDTKYSMEVFGLSDDLSYSKIQFMYPSGLTLTGWVLSGLIDIFWPDDLFD